MPRLTLSLPEEFGRSTESLATAEHVRTPRAEAGPRIVQWVACWTNGLFR